MCVFESVCVFGAGISPSGWSSFFTSTFCFQSVKILTYREPENLEYQEFISSLKTDAKLMFNYTIGDSLVRPQTGAAGGGHVT